ncbi:hypothetical protein L611_009900000020 [Aminobacter sp. J15]|nr:hypothetical protein L611_009900000020 [Aminobacter sp. J15]
MKAGHFSAKIPGQLSAEINTVSYTTRWDTIGAVSLGTAQFAAGELSPGFTRRMQISCHLPEDCVRLIVRWRYITPVGTAGANDFYQIENAFAVAGNIAPARILLPRRDVEVVAVAHSYYQTWLGSTVMQESGSIAVTSPGTALRITVPLPLMRARPGGLDMKVYSPTTGAAGKAAGSSGDVNASVVYSTSTYAEVSLTGLTAGATYRFHLSASAQAW